MSLVDVPISTACEIMRSVGTYDPAHRKYVTAGVSVGRHARVLARYPEVNPRFVEIELDGSRLVTLPVDVAEEVSVELLVAGGSS